MFTVAATETCILDLVQPFESDKDGDSLFPAETLRERDAFRRIEQVELNNALGRVIAYDVISEMDFPHFDNSAMDGYALRYEDIEENCELIIADSDIPAGAMVSKPLDRGQCARIFTGGMLPKGADTIVMQEDTERNGNALHLRIKPQFGEYVRHQGEFYRSGTTLIQAGTRISSSHLGVLAAARCGTVSVYNRPIVAILSTGSELVSLYNDKPLEPGQIIDSNQYALTALVEQAGAIALPMGSVSDRKEALFTAMTEAIAIADIVISSGGVSVGDYDYVDELLAQMGAKIHIRAVAIKPGKPLTVATIPPRGDLNNAGKISRAKLYFGVPGNPASAMVSFWRFIQGAIAKLSGEERSSWHPKFIKATTLGDLHAQGRRETYLWGHLSLKNGYWQFQPVDNYSSGNLVSLAGINGLAVLRVNQTYVPADDEVTVMLV
jgi:molybdopterin molybdotransferase